MPILAEVLERPNRQLSSPMMRATKNSDSGKIDGKCNKSCDMEIEVFRLA